MSALKLAPAWRVVEHGHLGVRVRRDAFFEVDLWSAPRTVRVGGDLFAPGVCERDMSDVLKVCEGAPEHTFLISTSNPGRMATITRDWRRGGVWPPPANVWLGTTLLTHLDAAARLEALVNSPAVKRFVELIPDLDVDVDPWVACSWCAGGLAGNGGACRECGATGKAIHWIFRGSHAEEAKPMTREVVSRLFRRMVAR